MNSGQESGLRVFPLLCLLFLSTFPAASHANNFGSGLRTNPSEAQYNCAAFGFEFVGNATLIDVGDWMFLNQTVFNSCAGNTDVVMFAVWKIASGQTVAVGTEGINLTAGETLDYYVPVFNISPGTYSVYLFGVAVPYNVPASFVQQVQITID